MDLSIIIINWNTCALLKDCLLSIKKNQPQCRFEIIVVDNASEDGSVAMMKREFPAITLLANKENIGFAAANNRAMKIAKGHFYLLLNSDTVVHGDVLQASFEYARTNHDIGALGCRVLNEDGSLQHSTSLFPSLVNLMLQTFALDRIPNVPFLNRYRMVDWDRNTARAVETISGCFMLVRKETLCDVGLLDENFFFFGEETDWCVRMRKNGWQVMFAPTGHITHYGGGSSASLSFKRDLMLSQATVRLHRKHKGLVAAALVYLLLMLFNISRACVWGFLAIYKKKQAAKNRFYHFLGISKHFQKAWPRKIGGAL